MTSTYSKKIQPLINIKIKNPKNLRYDSCGYSGATVEFVLTEMEFLSYDILGLAQEEKPFNIEVFGNKLYSYVIHSFDGPNKSKLYEVKVRPRI